MVGSHQYFCWGEFLTCHIPKFAGPIPVIVNWLMRSTSIDCIISTPMLVMQWIQPMTMYNRESGIIQKYPQRRINDESVIIHKPDQSSYNNPDAWSSGWHPHICRVVQLHFFCLRVNVQHHLKHSWKSVSNRYLQNSWNILMAVSPFPSQDPTKKLPGSLFQ